MKTLNLIILVLLPIFFSCKSEQKEEEKHIAELVNEWQGKKIKFPDNFTFTHHLTDTTDFPIPQSEYKVLVNINLTNYTSCKQQLHKWEEFIEYTDSITQEKVSFLFFFHSKYVKEIYHLLEQEEFNQSVCIDTDDQLNKLNKFPTNSKYNTFLLDKNNKVICIGSPINNINTRNVYIKQILENKKTESKQTNNITKIISDSTEYDIGIIKYNVIKEKNIKIKNIGKNTFYLHKLKSSCECTKASCKWKMLQPGDSGIISIFYNAEKTGDFLRTINIYGNIENNEFVVSIIGTVI